MRLRTAFLLALLAAAAPLLIFTVFAVGIVTDEVGKSFVEASLARNRATLAAVDAKLVGTVDAMRILANAPSLRSDDLRTFYRDAQYAIASQPDWLNVLLYDSQGQQLVNGRRPWGGVLPGSPIDTASFTSTVQGKVPSFSDVVPEDGANGDHVVSVRLPVIRADQVAYVLTVRLRPSSFQ